MPSIVPKNPAPIPPPGTGAFGLPAAMATGLNAGGNIGFSPRTTYNPAPGQPWSEYNPKYPPPYQETDWTRLGGMKPIYGETEGEEPGPVQYWMPQEGAAIPPGFSEASIPSKYGVAWHGAAFGPQGRLASPAEKRYDTDEEEGGTEEGGGKREGPWIDPNAPPEPPVPPPPPPDYSDFTNWYNQMVRAWEQAGGMGGLAGRNAFLRNAWGTFLNTRQTDPSWTRRANRWLESQDWYAHGESAPGPGEQPIGPWPTAAPGAGEQPIGPWPKVTPGTSTYQPAPWGPIPANPPPLPGANGPIPIGPGGVPQLPRTTAIPPIPVNPKLPPARPVTGGLPTVNPWWKTPYRTV